MLRFCSYSMWWILFLSRFYTPNMSKIGALLTMPKILNPIFLTIRKKVSPNFWYVAWKRLIYPGSDPKVVWNNGIWDLFLIGQVLKLNLCPKLLSFQIEYWVSNFLFSSQNYFWECNYKLGIIIRIGNFQFPFRTPPKNWKFPILNFGNVSNFNF